MLKHHKTIWLVSIVSIVIAIPMSFYMLYQQGYRINITPSIPRGIYKVEETKKFKTNDLVMVCLPNKVAKYANARGYIFKGSCDNGYSPLIKEIIAVPNDFVKMNKNGVTVNGKFYNLKQQLLDSHGRFLEPKTINQKIQGYLLIGYNSPNSWDSRYFGTVQSKDIQGVMHAIYTL